MTKRLFIDTVHPEEIRVALAEDDKLEKFEFEITSKSSIKGNIYLAKVISVEPSLQAAFIDYGASRHGFLGFSEIHPNYYQIPINDQQEIEKTLQEAEQQHVTESETYSDTVESGDYSSSEEEFDTPSENRISKLKHQLYKRYKLQEVIKKRQVMLVQVVKDERGTKGAALTTFMSLAGRFCILMPNTDRPCGISKKISAPADRQKMKKILASLDIPKGMCVVIRTAAMNHTKQEIKKDLEYVLKMWEDIKAETLTSQAPCMIREEDNIVRRSIRDLYDKNVSEVIVAGEEGYKDVKAFMKRMLPGHVRKIKHHDDASMNLFKKYGLSEQIQTMYSTRVDLPSGGYLIINTTEALVAIDVNSGKSAKDRSIAATAIRTNLEAAVEVARQCKLRDLGGIIVVDFIDMVDEKSDLLLEKKVKEAFLDDRARVQISHISVFGLMEISRQRLHSNLMETHRITCPYCSGIGSVWSTESMSVQILRQIEEICTNPSVREIKLSVSHEAAIFLMNNKKSNLAELERQKHCRVLFDINLELAFTDFKLEVVRYEQQKQLEVANEKTTIRIQNKQKQNAKQKRKFVKKEKNASNETRQTEMVSETPIALEPHNQLKSEKQPERRTQKRRSRTKVDIQNTEVKPIELQVEEKQVVNNMASASVSPELVKFQERVSKTLDDSIGLINEKEQLEQSYSSLMQKAIIVSSEIDRQRQNTNMDVGSVLNSQPKAKRGWWNKLIKDDNK